MESEDRVKTNGETDRRTKAIALPPSVTRSVKRKSQHAKIFLETATQTSPVGPEYRETDNTEADDRAGADGDTELCGPST